MTTLYPALRFTETPAATAIIRYRFNSIDGKSSVLHGGFDLGNPDLEGDPDIAGVDFGLRTVTFVHRVLGTKAAAMAKHSLVARELLRPDNWLLVQLAADRDPVWFHTYHTGATLSFENARDDAGEDAWDIGVSLPAEPFAYGEQVTMTPLTVNNNVAAGSNNCQVLLSLVQGDAPAPLKISVNPSNAAGTDGNRFMFSLMSPADFGLVVWQVGGTDGWTAGTDTSASTADATMSGGSRRRVSFATVATMATRLSGPAPAALPAAKYKVMVRVARSDTSSTFAMRFGQNIIGTYFYGDTVTMERDVSGSSNYATWVDLGDFNHPRDFFAGDGNAGFDYIPDISLQAQRLTGTGSLDIDAFALVSLKFHDIVTEAEAQTLFCEFPVIGIGTTTSFGVFDGDSELVWAYNSVGCAESGLRAELQGQFLKVHPGKSHLLRFFQQVNGRKPFFGSDSSDVITNTTVFTISYYPRWLWVGEG